LSYDIFSNTEFGDSSQFNSIRLKLQSPENILADSCGEVRRPETLNYRTLKPENMAYFVPKFTALSKTMNVYVVNIDDLNTVVLFVKNVVWKSPYQKFVAKEWGMLNWPVQLLIFGF